MSIWILSDAILTIRRQAYWCIAIEKLLTAHFLQFNRILAARVLIRPGLGLLNAVMLADLIFSFALLAKLLPSISLKLIVELAFDDLLAENELAHEVNNSNRYQRNAKNLD